HAARGVALDEVDRSTQPDAGLELDRFGDRSGVAIAAGREPERELEAPWNEAGLVLAHAAEPLAQVGADAGDALAPDALDRGRQAFVVLARDRFEHVVELGARA